ncbi:MAG: 1-acyl-sn-glycerol-3-phosphate acyltransferase [Methylophilales bacterium]|nr:1-acyl-sn-glycerol-3-phosphate acyltransferase [Methylophilales bacterium]
MTILRYLKLLLIFFHLLLGIFLSIIITLSTKKIQILIIQYWCNILLAIINVQIHCNINLSSLYKNNHYLVVSNHISWLDIIVLNALAPVSFVAKDNIKYWPIINLLAKSCDTIFINRDSLTDVRRIFSKVEAMLEKNSICIFPEGTSTNGSLVLPFKSNLFQAAINSKKDILPIALEYHNNDELLVEIGYYGDISLISSIWNVVGLNNIKVRLTVLPVIKSNLDRKLLAQSAFQKIRAIIAR